MKSMIPTTLMLKQHISIPLLGHTNYDPGLMTTLDRYLGRRMVHRVELYKLRLILLRLTTLGLLFLFPNLSHAKTSGQFFQPGVGEVWRVGDIMTIEYQTTLTNYTIALWQEALPKANAARKGPILFRKCVWGCSSLNASLIQPAQGPRQARTPGSSGRFSSTASI